MRLLDRERLALADDPKVSTVQVGVAKHQVAIVIDGIYRDPDYVRQVALSLEFTRSRGMFPGYEARLSLSKWGAAVAALLNARFASVLEPYDECKHEVVFSMTDERVDPKLRRIRLPHVDAGLTGRRLHAALVYLNPPSQCRGGTAFFRHRESGANEVVAEVSALFQAYQTRHTLPSALKTYDRILKTASGDQRPLEDGQWDILSDEDEIWEKTGQVDMVYNRLVVYNSRLFHAAAFSNGQFGTSQESRRITQTGRFVDREDPANIDPHGLIAAGLV
jgi:hypothetical protein